MEGYDYNPISDLLLLGFHPAVSRITLTIFTIRQHIPQCPPCTHSCDLFGANREPRPSADGLVVSVDDLGPRLAPSRSVRRGALPYYFITIELTLPISSLKRASSSFFLAGHLLSATSRILAFSAVASDLRPTT